MNTKFNDNFNFTPAEIGDASLKVLFKNFLFDYYEEIEEVFQQADPKTKLNFYKSIIPYVLAKQPSNENQGEWAPDQSMNTEWIKDYQRRKGAIKDKLQAKREREQKTNEFFKIQAAETEQWRKEFYRVGAEVAHRIATEESFEVIKNEIGAQHVKEEFAESLFRVIIAEFRKYEYEPPTPIKIFDRTVFPSEHPITTAEAELQTGIENNNTSALPLPYNSDKNDNQDNSENAEKSHYSDYSDVPGSDDNPQNFSILDNESTSSDSPSKT